MADEGYGSEDTHDYPLMDDGNEDSNPKQNPTSSRSALKDREQGSRYNPAGDDKPTVSPDDLEEAEGGATGDDEQLGSGFNSDDQPSRGRRATSFIRRNRFKILGGGFLTGGVVGLMFAFLALIPLKIENIIDNLQGRFFSSSTSAIQDATTNLFEHYVTEYLLPNYRIKGCGSTTDSSGRCKLRIVSYGSNPVTNLYRSWANDRIENKLAKAGLVIHYDNLGKTWRITYPGSDSEGDAIGNNGQDLKDEFDGRKQVRAIAGNAIAAETKWPALLQRYKIGRYLTSEFGQPRCLIFCGVKQTITDKKQVAKIYLTQRVITPYNTSLGIALECLLSNCDPTKTEPSDATQAPDLAGKPESSTDTQIRQTLGDIGSKETSAATYKEAQAIYKEISDQGFQKYMVTKALTPIVGDVTAGRVANAIPVIGWISLAAQIVSTANNAGPDIIKLAVAIKAAGAVNDYLMYRTYSDEIHTGNVDEAEVGSMVSSLGSGNLGSTSDPEVGGTAGAEDTPLYKAIMTGGYAPTNTASLLSSILPAKAYAATAASDSSSNSSTYLCNNGKPVPSGQLVCPEEMLGGGNSIANSVHDFLSKTPGVAVFTTLAEGWNNLFGPITNFFSSVTGPVFSAAVTAANAACSAVNTVSSLPVIGGVLGGVASAVAIVPGIGNVDLYCKAEGAVQSAIPKLVQSAATALFPNPFGTNMSGGRNFDMIALGADDSGSDYAHYGLGGKKVDTATMNKILRNSQAQAKEQFEQQSFFARMFDTSSPYSLVSGLAMDLPTNMQASVISGFADIVSNPFGLLSTSFASIFSGKTSADSAQLTSDPFGVPQYAVTNMPNDLEAYWNEHCTNNASQAYESDADYNATPAQVSQGQRIGNWDVEASGNLDTSTGLPTNTTTNPCLTIETATGVDGGLFDSSLLGTDDPASSSGSTSSSGSSPSSSSGSAASAAPPSGTAQQLAQQVLDAAKASKVSFINPPVNPANASDDSTPEDNLKDTANGQPAHTSTSCLGSGTLAPNRTADLNPVLLQFLVELSQKQSYQINELVGGCHAVGSNHYKGLAVDIGCPFDPTIANQIGQKYNISDQTGESCSNKARHFHYSIGGH